MKHCVCGSFLDLDRFKVVMTVSSYLSAINANRHRRGIRSCVRPSDVVARWAATNHILLNKTGGAGNFKVAERLQKNYPTV